MINQDHSLPVSFMASTSHLIDLLIERTSLSSDSVAIIPNYYFKRTATFVAWISETDLKA